MLSTGIGCSDPFTIIKRIKLIDPVDKDNARFGKIPIRLHYFRPDIDGADMTKYNVTKAQRI